MESWREFGPWYIITKTILAALLAMCINLATHCLDDVSTSFTSFLVVSAVVSQGLKNGFHVLWAGLMGSLLGLISVAVWGLANTPIDSNQFPVAALPWLRVPLTMGAAVYFLFLLKQFQNPAAATSAVFSALFVQQAQIAYPPIIGAPTWIQVLVTRILALTTATLAATIINFLISGLFYSNIFRNQQYVAETQLTFALPQLLKSSFDGEFIFGSILGKLGDGHAAMQELKLLSCECWGGGRGSMLRAFQAGETPDVYRARLGEAKWTKKQLRRISGPFRATYTQLLNYTWALKCYLQLASIFAFTGKCGKTVKIPPTLVNGNVIVWLDVLDDILLKSVTELGRRLGWPPAQSETRKWRGKSLTDRIFRRSVGKRGLLMKPPVTDEGVLDAETVDTMKPWSGPRTSLVKDVVIRVLSEAVGTGADVGVSATPETLFALVRPTVQNIVMSLDAVVEELLYMMGERSGDGSSMDTLGGTPALAVDITDSDSDDDRGY